MRLENVDKVAKLRDRRAAAVALLAAAPSGNLSALEVCAADAEGVSRFHKVFDTVGSEHVRAAIICAAQEAVDAIDKELHMLGVAVRAPIERHTLTIDDYKRDAEMYSRAWLRELGGSLVPKRHFIDALVLTTRELRARAERALDPGAGA